MSKEIKCKGCQAATDPLDLFPGNVCLNCWAESEEGNKPLTAESVAGMWKKGIVK